MRLPVALTVPMLPPLAMQTSSPAPGMVALSLRLMRKGRTVQTSLKADHDLSLTPASVGSLFIGQSQADPPIWTKFLKPLSPVPAARLRTQSCSAVLFIETVRPAKRLFAVCFGQGHHSLDDGAVEKGFGLKVTLNCVARDRLKTIDSAALDSTVMQRRTQASRNSDLQDFQIDTDRELLRLASGSPVASDFAKAVTGKDAIKTTTKLSATDIVCHCEKALRLYGLQEYKKSFAFIDHVTPVGDRALSAQLDAIAFAELTKLVSGHPSDIHLAIPEVLCPEEDFEIGYFGVGLNPGSKTSFLELAIEDYISELQRGDFAAIPDMAALKPSHEIRIVEGGQGDKSHKRKLYTCLVFETVLRGHNYVLFDGQWFLVARGFFQEVEAAYQALLKPAFVASTTAKNEREFIDILLSDNKLLCMDQTKVNPEGASRAALEPCDFLSRSKQLIHLKDGHASAPLSHLWNQGLVAAESFKGDGTFRSNFRLEAIKREKKHNRQGFAGLLPDGRTKPNPADFPIVFGVLRHPTGQSNSIGLPFFSKVALRAVAHRLDVIGFPVELHLIAKK